MKSVLFSWKKLSKNQNKYSTFKIQTKSADKMPRKLFTLLSNANVCYKNKYTKRSSVLLGILIFVTDVIWVYEISNATS